MKIHTDHIHRAELFEALQEVDSSLVLNVSEHRSYKRARMFNAYLKWAGEVNYERRRNASTHWTAATWDEWGLWIDRLFQLDPEAIIGQYHGYEDFLDQTEDAVRSARGVKPKAPWLDKSRKMQ